MKSTSILIVLAALVCTAAAWTPMEDVHMHKAAMLETESSGVRALDVCEEIGDACSHSKECEKEHYLSDVRCVEGKCIDLEYIWPLDASCRNPAELGNSKKICVAGTCDTTENECIAKKLLGSACDSDSECVSGACLGDNTKACGRKRSAKLSVGDDCAEDSDCATGWCDPNENDNERGKCAKFDVGVACTYSRKTPTYNICGFGHYCKYVNETLATCQPWEAIGEFCNAEHACGFTYEEDVVKTWGVCDNNECKQVGSLADGETCQIGDVCNSLTCYEDKCRMMDNELCREDRDCGEVGGFDGEGLCACYDRPRCAPHAEITKNLLFDELSAGADGLQLHDAVNDYWVCVSKNNCDGNAESIELGTVLKSCVRNHCEKEAIAYICHKNCNVNVDQRDALYNCATNERYSAGASASVDRTFTADETVADSCPNGGAVVGASMFALGVAAALFLVL